MTNLEAIKAKLSYPLSDNSYILALSDRGLSSTATYASTDKQALELAQADLIYTLITVPNVTEGGYSVSISDKNYMLKLADSIYAKYNVRPLNSPRAKFVQKW